MNQPVMSQANACICMHYPMMSQTDACSYCMGSVVLISSQIYLYSSYFALVPYSQNLILDFPFLPHGRRSYKTFRLGGKTLKQPNAVTSNGGCPLQHHQVTNQKALRQGVHPFLQPENHHTPDLHTVAPGLCTLALFTNK
jgi:hypothetical protein